MNALLVFAGTNEARVSWRNDAAATVASVAFFVFRATVLFSQQQLCPQPPSGFSQAVWLVFLKLPAPVCRLEWFLNLPLFLVNKNI